MTVEREGRLPQNLIDQLDPLTGLVLYRTPRRWQYTVHAGGVTCGHLVETPLDADEREAQRALVGVVEGWTGKAVEATWRATDLDWWAADARYLPPGSAPR